MFAFLFDSRDLGPLSALTFVFGIAYGASMPLYALVTREYFGEQARWARPSARCSSSRVSGCGLGSYGGGFLYHMPSAPMRGCSWPPAQSAPWRLFWA